MTCIIVEDQPPARRMLRQFITDVDDLRLVGEFGDALQAMDWLNAHQTDLVFLDVHLPKLSGMDLLRTLQDPPHVILTTAFPDFALESYEYNVVDYLLKPFSFARFAQAVTKAQALHTLPAAETEEPQELFLKSGYEYVRVTVADVRYIHSDADYTEFHLPGRKLLSPEPLRHWLETLDPGRFVRIHRSYILHLDHLDRVAGGRAHLTDGTTLPIGRAHREAFLAALKV